MCVYVPGGVGCTRVCEYVPGLVFQGGLEVTISTMVMAKANWSTV